jgi:ferredoxin--NADP+ reductase
MMAKITDRRRLIPNLHLIEVHAPEVARKCRPGQFVILMPDEKGERIPLSIADFDAEKGTVTSVFLLVGTSTHKLSQLRPGDDLPVYVGPLGKPSEIANFGTIVLAGGCFGIGAIYPAARALKQAGNRVIVVLDAKARFLLYWEDKFRAVSDKLVVASRDFSLNANEYIPARIEEVLKSEKVDRVIAIGCTYLMYACSMATKPLGIPTVVSLNPIMVDGTGMCGACRCTSGGQTKFACVDGPDFNGHELDWEEVFKRRKAYLDDEISSLCHWERNLGLD